MAAAPRLSVVVNACNGAPWIAAALESASAQTWPDFELLVWDDASTDATAQIAAAHADPRLVLHRLRERVPLGAARVQALRAARGAWIAFLDQDDLWLPDKLERQLALIDAPGASDVALVYGRALAFDATGRERPYHHLDVGRPLPEGRIFERLVEVSNFIAMSSALVRADACRDALPRLSALHVAVDYALFTHLARRHEARALQRVCCRYRLHAANMSRTTARRSHLEALAVVEAWAAELPPALLARRRAVYHTLIGLEECRAGEWAAGLRRIASRGSLSWLAARPVVRALRAVRAARYAP